MEDKYKPTKKEVLKEIVTPLLKKSKDYLKISLEGNLSFYVIPTVIRKSWATKTNEADIAFCAAQGVLYGKLIFEQHIPAYLLPLATNVLSGVYELGRFVYKNAEKRLLTKNLEKITEK